MATPGASTVTLMMGFAIASPVGRAYLAGLADGPHARLTLTGADGKTVYAYLSADQVEALTVALTEAVYEAPRAG